MRPPWYRSRLFLLGLFGLALWTGAWMQSYARGRGDVWNWNGPTRFYFVSHGGGWMGLGTGESISVRYPAILPTNRWDHRKWDLKYSDRTSWFPPVQTRFDREEKNLWIHYSFWITAWSVAWLIPLAARYLPRRARPPRFPGTPRRWFTSPWLWGGLPGAIVLIALWIDSATYRSYASMRWTRAAEPDYVGLGVESSAGHLAAWAGRPTQGLFSRTKQTGYSGFRQKSQTLTPPPATASKPGIRRFHTTWLTLASTYFILWLALAATWQYRQSKQRPSVRDTC
ncbi:hypothetical protein [Luteolibacter soli]|uniref:DUF3592 domain-containing protein n=1 Tax=Luteolibacter soli TaxID=3135280 RepID=A0ABU9AXR5_9BACT